MPTYNQPDREDDEAAPTSRARTKPPGGSGGRGGAVLGAIALLVALLTAGYVVYRDPPWGRLGKYSFSNAEQALRSETKIEANGDIHAMIELQAKLDRRQSKEKLSSLTVERTAEYKGKTALFIKYKVTDKETKKEKERKEVAWYEKDDASGYWHRTFVSVSPTDDKKLSEDISTWQRGNFGDPD